MISTVAHDVNTCILHEQYTDSKLVNTATIIRHKMASVIQRRTTTPLASHKASYALPRYNNDTAP